jgi:hypothetical protein
MTKIKLYVLTAAFQMIALGFAGSAGAVIHLTAEGGASFNTSNYGFVSSPSPLVSAQATFGLMDLLQYGFVYDRNFLSGGYGALNFYGGIVHVGFFDGLFVDGQAGVDNRDGAGSSFSWGVGGGYAFPLTFLVDVGPRINYRSVPDSGTERSLFDAGIFLTLKFI